LSFEAYMALAFAAVKRHNQAMEPSSQIRSDDTEVAQASLRKRAWLFFHISKEKMIGIGYPPQCVSCREITAETATLCATCWRNMPFISRPFCERLGTPFGNDIGGTLLSPAAIADPPVFNRARSVAHHDGAARELVHKLKYGDRQELAIAMGRMMTAAAKELLDDATVIVPIPLHWTRLWQRRFNQATALANQIAKHSGLKVETTFLRRRKRTLRQVGLTKAQRQQNLQGAFTVPDDVKVTLTGQRILLVDDVMTTSSTANAAARVLLRAGAASVDIVTFARVVTGS
jgi:ComF family protein